MLEKKKGHQSSMSPVSFWVSDGRLGLRLAEARRRALCSGLARRLNSFSYTSLEGFLSTCSDYTDVVAEVLRCYSRLADTDTPCWRFIMAP